FQFFRPSTASSLPKHGIELRLNTASTVRLIRHRISPKCGIVNSRPLRIPVFRPIQLLKHPSDSNRNTERLRAATERLTGTESSTPGARVKNPVCQSDMVSEELWNGITRIPRFVDRKMFCRPEAREK